ncbi:MAG: substrate-binding domain-containing protein [Spirochaetales bacterium]|nr:substrate-binding domain-containing protein [Spirochaetales bacterium]
MRFGLILKNLDEEYQLSVYRGATREAAARGVRLICIHGEQFTALRHFPLRAGSMALPLDGILLLSSIISDNSRIGMEGLNELPQEVPLVSIGSVLDAYHSLIVDASDALHGLMDHLLQVHGYRRFLYLGGPVTNSDNMHRQGIIEQTISRMKGTDPAYSLRVMNGDMFSEHVGAKLMRTYIADHPVKDVDVIICGSDEHALGALSCLEGTPRGGWNTCPVTGFDDVPFAAMNRPALTTIRQPMEDVGRMAVETLEALVEGRSVPMVVTVPAQLVVRGSCGCTSAEIPGETPGNFKDADSGFRTVSYFGQSLMWARSEADICAAIREYLVVFKVEHFHLLVFDEPSPEIPATGSLIYSQGEGGASVWKKGEHPVSVAGFFDEAVRPDSQGTGGAGPCFLFQLCAGDMKLGMFLYTADDSALPHMSNFGVFLANSLRGLSIMEREKAYAQSLEQKVEERTAQLRKEGERRALVEAEVLRISDLERMRFSMDLHDDICQRLAGIHMICKSYADAGPHMKILTKMASEALQQTRTYAYSSFPIDVHAIGLEQAIRSLCTDIDGTNGISCRFVCAARVADGLSDQQAVNLYRIAREAVHNAVKHAAPSLIEVVLAADGTDLLLEVRDNGRGSKAVTMADFPLEQTRRPRGIGLRSMQYRAHQLNGSFSITSGSGNGEVEDKTEGHGTRVSVRMPLIKE